MCAPVSLIYTTTRFMVEEMSRARVNRLVAVTGFGAGESREPSYSRVAPVLAY